MLALRQRAWQRLVAAAPPEWVLRHCRAVEGLAVAMCDAAEKQGLAPDRGVVQAAALLHDVGRSKVQDVRHASTGAALLRADVPPWDETIVLAVERHTGAGIDAAEAKALGLPVQDYTPRTLEERIVAHADNLYTGDRRLTMAELRAKYEAKHLPAAWQRIERLHRSLGEELGVDLEQLAPARLPP
ncbi:MAG: HD domain-containing protein [Thermoplasmatota archaeon]|nr:HD domain-containing protein [Halobacteriales archaeon]